MENKPDGYVVALFSSFVQPKLLLGVPMSFMVLNVTIGASVIQYFGAYFITVNLIVHIVGLLLTTKEPRFMEIAKGYLKQQSFYD